MIQFDKFTLDNGLRVLVHQDKVMLVVTEQIIQVVLVHLAVAVVVGQIQEELLH